jgi:Carboxypeptidase regulatory-like domain
LTYRTVATILLLHLFSAALLCQEPASSQEQQPQSQQQPQTSAAQSQMGNIMGTVTAVNGSIVPGASVVVEGATPNDRRTAVADDKGFFEIDGLTPGSPYHVSVSAEGFEDWNSPAITVSPGQYLIVKDCKLKVAEVKTTVTVGAASSVELATEQLKVEETQRVFGIIPNFYVVYDKNAAPLTAKMKFQLALRTSVDPITFIGVGIIAGVDQATDRPEYVQGAKGFGQRLGASYADGFSDILIGGAILPALLHQDPRYYYQGTGTTKSRALHAISRAFVCKGDNGRMQPNYSTIGGDLASSALTMTYYPDSDRNASTVYESFLIGTAERMAANLAQEFIFQKLTKIKKPKK